MPNTYNYKEYIAKDSEEVFALISDTKIFYLGALSLKVSQVQKILK